jgi:hypothetical protein
VAIILVASFAALAALWPDPRLERAGWRPVWRVPRALEIACGAVGVALLALALWAGFAGTQDTFSNFTPTFVLILFWVGLVFASIVLGDVFRAFNPWRAIGRVLFARARRPYPQRLGHWPAAAGLLGFTWIELASGYGEEPRKLALAAAIYTVLTLAAMAVYGAETWSRRGEAFGVYFGLFARLSPFEVRDGRVGVRRVLSGLTRLEPLPGTVAVVCVMIGTVTFDGFSQGNGWKRHLAGWLQDLLGSPRAAATAGLLLGIAVVAAVYELGITGVKSVGGRQSLERLRRAFVHSLVPIAAVYAMAHYLSYLLLQGQAIAYLSSDPLGRGWNLLGTAGAAIDYGVLPQDATWYLQVAVVVLGHVAALVLAHDRALTLYKDGRLAVRSQYWMLGVMVGYTSLALWLLSQANA